MDEQLKKFLNLIPTANWRQPPKVWNDQLRQALGESYVTVGFGGVLKLTDAGREAVTAGANPPAVGP